MTICSEQTYGLFPMICSPHRSVQRSKTIFIPAASPKSAHHSSEKGLRSRLGRHRILISKRRSTRKRLPHVLIPRRVPNTIHPYSSLCTRPSSLGSGSVVFSKYFLVRFSRVFSFVRPDFSCLDTLRTTTPLVTKVFLEWLVKSYVYYRLSDEERAAGVVPKPRGIGYGIGLAIALFTMQGTALRSSITTNLISCPHRGSRFGTACFTLYSKSQLTKTTDEQSLLSG